MRPLQIAPSILAADFGRFTEEIKAIDEAGADVIHVDVMDGHFVPNLTFGAKVVEAAKKATDKTIDAHLMVSNPDPMLADFASAGADIITVHAEACPHLNRTLSAIRDLGVRAGVALNPHTSGSALVHLWDYIDLILVMSVNPGFGGQSFIPAVLPKIRALRAYLENDEALSSKIDIEVDGGIKPTTAAEVAEAGANVLVAGSAVFGQSDYQQAILDIRTAALNAIGV